MVHPTHFRHLEIHGDPLGSHGVHLIRHITHIPRTYHLKARWVARGLSHCTYIAFTLQSTCTYLVANTHVRKQDSTSTIMMLLCQEEIPSHHITYVSTWCLLEARAACKAPPRCLTSFHQPFSFHEISKRAKRNTSAGAFGTTPQTTHPSISIPPKLHSLSAEKQSPWPWRCRWPPGQPHHSPTRRSVKAGTCLQAPKVNSKLRWYGQSFSYCRQQVGMEKPEPGLFPFVVLVKLPLQCDFVEIKHVGNFFSKSLQGFGSPNHHPNRRLVQCLLRSSLRCGNGRRNRRLQSLRGGLRVAPGSEFFQE